MDKKENKFKATAKKVVGNFVKGAAFMAGAVATAMVVDGASNMLEKRRQRGEAGEEAQEVVNEATETEEVK
jgi:hypothetical protein